MNSTQEDNVICLACSVFKDDLIQLQKTEKLPFNKIDYFDSMLHMYPERLESEVFPRVFKAVTDGLNVLLLYGDCHPLMNEFELNKHVVRVAGVNCYQLILGMKRYKTMQREDTFFLLPEWVNRWQEVFRVHLGLDNQHIAREFMQDFFKQIVYIHTGKAIIADNYFKEIEAFTGLPVKVLDVGLNHLKRAIIESFNRLKQKI
ncbi:MAG: DUF1638 domain-containing protein [Candidatus Magnetoovum sp. WYHC-5]|nr:DUF1638 domain-containing protein [Candidatus Magnetoovum sp. WYHC-5]